MERTLINLSEQAFLLINGPLIFLNLTANIFYACCLIFPTCNRQRFKQPLNILLGYLVWCTIFYFISLMLVGGVINYVGDFNVSVVSWMILSCYVHCSMTCSVWLNFYYYIQIVPSQRALLIWVKRNLRSITCVALFLDAILFCFDGVINIVHLTTSSGFTDINDTWTDNHIEELYLSSQVCFFILKVYIWICLCIMMVSSFSTAHYLYRHIRSMAWGGSYFSCPTIRSQMRVTITGISQAVLYLLYATFYFFDAFTYIFSSQFHLNTWVSFTVTSLYLSGTTVNLGIGQTAFKRSAADVWKALKALCGVGMATNDVKMHSSQLTSGEIANTVTVGVQMSLR
ncbi:taste receptor type 2 member 7-like [Dicentrarchus labrax]|uniref:Taste receptor type 2 n=1 Tax=Dicentrarchus labrax TaxID=13489 RepID=A0A8C4DK16_DICLA|nr:taste receptor type 2 member 7-like [Dicentrarchus labrax]